MEENYRWEAERPDKEIVTGGGDLGGCVRFSLIPSVPGLERVDVVGVTMKNRFSRAFLKVSFGQGKLDGKPFWENGSTLIRTNTDYRDVLEPGDMIKREGSGFPWHLVVDVGADYIMIDRVYDYGKSKAAWTVVSKRSKQNGNSRLHCVICQGCRVYVNDSTGQVFVTPEDYEMYL